MARPGTHGNSAASASSQRRSPPANGAAVAVARTLAAGVEAYDRQRHLPRLIPLTPSQLADLGLAARRAILARLARALRAERMRGRAGHWTYDLNRHIGLHQAYLAERLQLDGIHPRSKARRADGAAAGR